MSDMRREVRVLLIDPRDRVLLLWHSRPADDDHWAPLGGGIEVGEDLRQAADRELREEVGLAAIRLRRPVAVWLHDVATGWCQTAADPANHISLACGLATTRPGHPTDPRDLLNAADAAQTQAKRTHSTAPITA